VLAPLLCLSSVEMQSAVYASAGAVLLLRKSRRLWLLLLYGIHAVAPLSTETDVHAAAPLSTETDTHAAAPLSTETGAHAAAPLSIETDAHAAAPLSTETGAHAAAPRDAKLLPTIP
jgi:hypothetical protein